MKLKHLLFYNAIIYSQYLSKQVSICQLMKRFCFLRHGWRKITFTMSQDRPNIRLTCEGHWRRFCTIFSSKIYDNTLSQVETVVSLLLFISFS
jgi:hypothetical protein